MRLRTPSEATQEAVADAQEAGSNERLQRLVAVASLTVTVALLIGVFVSLYAAPIAILSALATAAALRMWHKARTSKIEADHAAYRAGQNVF